MNHKIPDWYIPTEEVKLGHSACDVCGVELPEDRPELDGKKYCPRHVTAAPNVEAVTLNNFKSRCRDCGQQTEHVYHRPESGNPRVKRLGPSRQALCADCGVVKSLDVNHIPRQPSEIRYYRGGKHRGR